MDFNLSKKRARSHSIEAEEPPNKKLCASGPGPNRSGMILPSHPEPSISEDRLPLTSNVLEEEAEFEAEMNVIAEKNGVTEQGTTVSRTVFRIVKANMVFDRFFGRKWIRRRLRGGA